MDPLADALTNIRNNELQVKDSCVISPASKLIGEFLSTMQKENYIGNFEYIDDNGNSILFYGTPWCHQFGNWAFMASDEFIKNKYEKIPNNIDILITHDPFSLGTVGTIQEGYYTGEQAGNKVLTDTIIHLENPPKIVFSGHIHTGNHNLDTFSIANKDGKVNTIKFMNVSLLNEDYNHVYDPAYIDYK